MAEASCSLTTLSFTSLRRDCMGQEVTGLGFYYLLQLLAVSSAIVNVEEMIPWRPTMATRRYLFYGYVYVLLALVVFHFTLWDFGISFYIFVYEGVQPFLNAATFGSALFCALGVFAAMFQLGVRLASQDWPSAIEAVWEIVAFILVTALFPAWMVYFTISNQIQIVPDLAVTINERDQLAALIAGAMTLAYTMYTAIRDPREISRQLTDVDMEERQGLNTTQEELFEEPRVLWQG